MRPTVRSRLWAAGTAFVAGFVVANVGILLVVGADRWLWLAVAVVLMVTGALGVLVADSRRPVSLWAVLGVELFAVGTLLPLLSVLSRALSPGDEAPTSLWPADADWTVFGAVLGSDVVRHAATTTVGVASVATLVAMLLAVPAAYGLARRRTRRGGLVLGALVAAFLVPTVAVAVPWTVTALDLDLYGSRWVVVVPLLALTVPLAVWLSLPVVRRAPWELRDSIRSDGATRGQELRAFAVPLLLPDLLVVAALVWVVAAQDVVLGTALGPTEGSRTLSAALLAGDVDPQGAAAVALLWMLPVLVLVAVVPRRVHRLIGRDHR